jgi:glutathione S-transferase
MNIIVHHLNNSRSQRVLWLLEELGVSYDVRCYERDKRTRLAPPELRAIHPLGKSPVVEAAGNVLAETGAIVEYLIDKHGEGRLRPAPDTPERLRYTYWLHYAEGSAMPPLLLRLMLQVMATRTPALLRGLVKSVTSRTDAGFVAPQLKTHMDFWESELGKAAWLAGEEISGADIVMSFPAEAAAARANATEGRPKLAAWLARIHARPAYQRALERGGPYAIIGG